ncbi:hypothetical protein DYB37_012629 [Aphanomyces astaci]|uniref:Uncharacterized protein n=1 Tax=Aphanomyces astaci TaxID=112090 RepID=A0A3R7F4S4_APHAT|nr:hypothetical protein DYB37_012629 [Aphanomyces astaci]
MSGRLAMSPADTMALPGQIMSATLAEVEEGQRENIAAAQLELEEMHEEEYPKEIEDRLYPITTADVRMQTDRIRERRKNPAQDEILKTLNLLPSDAYLLLAPADIEDEAKWYVWFADTLNKCGEAKTSEAVAHIQWVDPNPYDVLCEAGDEFDDSPCPGLYASKSKRKRSAR